MRESTRQLKVFRGHSQVALRWFLLMHLHLNLMGKNKVIMLQWENMPRLLIQQP